MVTYNRQYTAYQLKKKSFLRARVREYYLNAARALLKGPAPAGPTSEGPTIDFGCGTGELLTKLPAGSLGLDINPVTVDHCLSEKLNVRLYDPEEDQYKLSFIEPGRFDSLIVSHVLEHLKHPDAILRSLLSACGRLGIRRCVVVVPGKKGFAFDSTHITHMNRAFFKTNRLMDVEGLHVIKIGYFPVNIQWLENYFTHHELQVVYDRELISAQ